MRLMIYEGTPEEISQVAAALRPLSPSEAVVAPTAVTPTAGTLSSEGRDKNDKTYVSVEFARLMLSRRQLSPEQLKTLRAIYEAHPKRISAPELQKRVGYSRSQFSGLMGAFGRRLSHTPGYDEVAWFFDATWDYGDKTYLYALPETVREALRLEGLV